MSLLAFGCTTRALSSLVKHKRPPLLLPPCRPFSVLPSVPAKFSGYSHKTRHTIRNNTTWRAVGLLIGSIGLSFYLNTEAQCEFQEPDTSHLPEYTREEISKHKTKETGIWVIHNNGVYDITDFVEGHPGGLDKIMLAAGKSIDPFWKMYQQHNVDHIREMLETFRIGNLAVSDRIDPSTTKDSDDPYANEPERAPFFTINSQNPFNAEPPLPLLIDKLTTPIDMFFVRNHLPVPIVDPKTYVLEIKGEGVDKTYVFTLDDLKTKFPKNTVNATIQCAGNRRSELSPIKPLKGLPWGAGAISNGEWSGVYLRDVLKAIGVDDTNPNIKHIIFEGLDKDITAQSYGASIPIDVYQRTDVLLAYEMNGVELPRDHGFVPGVVGARNVKWLARVITSKEESKSFWQQHDYKGFSPSTDWDNIDYNSAPAIQELPVQSAVSFNRGSCVCGYRCPLLILIVFYICTPTNGTSISNDQESLTVLGYAWSGGGRGIVRVDVSFDGGVTWQVANLERVEQERGKNWAWAKFKTSFTMPENYTGPINLCCRAVDDAYNVQPDSLAPVSQLHQPTGYHVWNVRGVLNNAWHRVSVNVVPPSE